VDTDPEAREKNARLALHWIALHCIYSITHTSRGRCLQRWMR
jgi:hypothetical protein